MTAMLPITPASLVVAPDWRDYALLDTGVGNRLERVGPHRLQRPDAQALGLPALEARAWQGADAVFSGGEADDEEARGRWRFARPLPEAWPVRWRDITLMARCTPFRHLGFFPEQAAQWDFADRVLRTRPAAAGQAEVLNLFGYTGAASLVAAAAGARVTHVDASKKAIGYARENQAASGLDERPIRWIVEDALTFVRRELRRGRRYHGIIVDPPRHGRGPDGEVWQLETDLPELLNALGQLLHDRNSAAGPCFVVLTVYAVRLSHLAIARALAQALAHQGGTVEAGDMALPVEGASLHPTAIYARWVRP
jgi:23S rRNA (cytosine1962-C5)-methyltransferase